jgi:hypothetical protein
MQIKHRSFTVLIMAIDVQWDVKMSAFSMRLCVLAQPHSTVLYPRRL